MTPLTEPSSREYSPVLACHKRGSRLFVNAMMACKHTCSSPTGCYRGGSLWNRAFAKGACGTPPIQYLLRGGYKRGLHAFQGGERHNVHFDASEEEKEGGGAGGSNCRKVSPHDAAWGYAVR